MQLKTKFLNWCSRFNNIGLNSEPVEAYQGKMWLKLAISSVIDTYYMANLLEIRVMRQTLSKWTYSVNKYTIGNFTPIVL